MGGREGKGRLADKEETMDKNKEKYMIKSMLS
jgi:hypothetical protein